MHARSGPEAAGRDLRRRPPRLILFFAALAAGVATAATTAAFVTNAAPAAPLATLAEPAGGAWSWSAPPTWQTAGASVGVTSLTKAPGSGIYVVGFQNTSSSKTVVARRVTSAGVVAWAVSLRGMIGKGAWANDAASDRWGNLYVAGGSVAARGSVAMLAKLSAAGKLLWRRALPTIGGTPDEATALTIDGSGNVFVTAVVRSRTKLADIVTAKFSPTGARLWSYTYATKFNDRPSDIALDSSGNLYVAGLAGSRSSTTGAGLLLKISAAGHGVWARTITRPGSTIRVQGLFVATRATSIWTAGQIGTSSRDAFVARFTLNGRTQVYNVCRAAAGDDVLRGLVVDGAGNAYLAGYRRALALKAGFLAKFTPAGVKAWDATFASTAPGGTFDTAYYALLLDTSGALYAAGLRGVGAGATQAIVARVATANGRQTVRWAMGGAAGADSFGTVLSAGPSLVYAGGSRSGAGNPAFVQRLLP